MIIDSHEHLLEPLQLQISKMDQAGIDKAILFSTTPTLKKLILFQH